MKQICKKINANSVSLAGEFAVLSRLSLYGYDANMTLGHTKNIDILISDPKTNRIYKLEVKTNLYTKKNSISTSRIFGKISGQWMMGKKHEIISRDELWYCFVMIKKETNESKFYIIPSHIVSSYVKLQHEYWLKSDITHKDSDIRVFRLGLKSENYNIDTPLAEDYENNWNFDRK